MPYVHEDDVFFFCKLLMPPFSGQNGFLEFKLSTYITFLVVTAACSVHTSPAICDYCQMLQKKVGRMGSWLYKCIGTGEGLPKSKCCLHSSEAGLP